MIPLSALRLDHRVEADLTWRFRYADGEIKGTRSLHEPMVRQLEDRMYLRRHPGRLQRGGGALRQERSENGYLDAPSQEGWLDEGLRCGPVFVGGGEQLFHPAHDVDWRPVKALRRARRIDEQLRLAGADVERVLRAALGEKPDAALDGLGPHRNLLLLVAGAAAAHKRSRTKRPLRVWLERLAQKVRNATADVVLVRELRRVAEVELLRAGRAYQGVAEEGACAA